MRFSSLSSVVAITYERCLVIILMIVIVAGTVSATLAVYFRVLAVAYACFFSFLTFTQALIFGVLASTLAGCFSLVAPFLTFGLSGRTIIGVEILDVLNSTTHTLRHCRRREGEESAQYYAHCPYF